MLRQLGYRPIALDGGQSHLALKAGEWFRRGRLLMVSPVHGNYRRCQAEIPLIVLSRFLRPALGLGTLKSHLSPALASFWSGELRAYHSPISCCWRVPAPKP